MTLLVAVWLAAGAGFIALSYEILWYRAFSFVSEGQASVFGLLLSFYLFGIACGALLVRRGFSPAADVRRMADPQGRWRWRLVLMLLAANLAAFLVIPALARLASWNWYAGFLLVAIATAVMGAVFPVLSHYAIPPDDWAGSALSLIYVGNILGSAAGSVLTGFVLLDRLSTQGVSVLLAGLGVVLAAVPALLAARWRKPALAGAVACFALLGVTSGPLFDRLYERLLQKGRRGVRPPVTTVVENRHGVIAVEGDGRLYGGGAYDGAFNVSLDDDLNLIERAFAVAALHPHPADVLMVGLGSGSWAEVVSHLPGVEHLTVIEINPGYLSLLPRYPAVAGLVSNPKVHVEIDDARRWLQRRPDARFDVIVMNTTWHWRAHASSLLSKEFFEIARAHLRPGGVHYLNATGSREVERTAAEAFPFALRFLNMVAVSDAPLRFNRERWRTVLTTPLPDGKTPVDLGSAGKETLERLLALPDAGLSIFGRPTMEERASLIAESRGLRTVTDDNMACEWKTRP